MRTLDPKYKEEFEKLHSMSGTNFDVSVSLHSIILSKIFNIIMPWKAK